MGAYLSSPVTKKVQSDGSNGNLAFGSCAMQGMFLLYVLSFSIKGWRKDMEDSHFELINFTERNGDSLFAVFDGHGGSAVARFCSENFPSVLLRDSEYLKGNIAEALRRTYLKLDEMLREPENVAKLKTYVKPPAYGSDTPPVNPRRSLVNPALNAGCTAVVVHILGNVVTVANSGDSRAVLCRDGSAIDLTIDHKVTLESEIERISAAGGLVLNGRVNGSLNLTRAIGDLAFKGDASLPPEDQVITANPDVRVIEVNPEFDDFIVLACDGLWEVITSQEVVDYVSHGLRSIRGDLSASPDSNLSKPPTLISEVIGNMLDLACSDDVGATEGLGGDNLSCIVIDLRPDQPLSNIDRVSRFESSTEGFVLKPKSYKIFEFRSKSGSSSSSEAFRNTEDWECRVEKLEKDSPPSSPTSI
jgi:protein phosphatase 1G